MRNRIISLATTHWHAHDKLLLCAFILGIIAASPFLRYSGLPRANDAELHIFRIAELGYSLRAGNLYPRWAPDFYHGFGYPIFNYYAPFIYHLGNWLTLFRPENAAVGAKLIFILAHIIGAVGAYLLGREFGGQGGGLLGSAAFAFSPYILLINPHIRGDLAEVFAIALIPWALWAWEKLWETGTRAAFVGAVLFPAVTLLSHNLTGLTLMVLLLTLSIWQWLILKRRQGFISALMAGILVMLLTAYFWFPFLLERSYIKLDVAGEGHYDFRQHFVSFNTLVAPLQLFDRRSATMQAPMSAGPMVLFLAFWGIVYAFWKSYKRCFFYAISSLLCLWLIMPSSRFLWEMLPGMAFYQFPWRFLGPLASLLIPLVANLANSFLAPRWSPLFMASLLCILIFPALPGLYPHPWESAFEPITRQHYIAIELEGRWRGTTSTNDFVPTTVDMIPGPEASVLASYQSLPIDRVNRHTLPAHSEVEVLSTVPWHNQFRDSTPKKFILRLYLFYFPGWQAYLNGEVVDIDIARPEGFVTIAVPEGEHDIVLRFEDTLVRKLGWGLALLGSLVFTLIIYHMHPREHAPRPVRAKTGPHVVRWMRIEVIALILLKVVWLDSCECLYYTSPPHTAQAARHQQDADFGHEVMLLGFDLSTRKVKPGGTLDVTLYWNAQGPITRAYQSFVHLVYPEGTIWTQSDHLNPGGFPTYLWPTDRYICDKHRLKIPDNLTGGEYFLSIGLYTLSDERRLPVYNATIGMREDNLILSETISVKK